MPNKLLALIFVFTTIHLASCASTTMINSDPSGAKLYIDGSYVGQTPYSYSDTKIVGSSTDIQLKKEGCESSQFILSRTEKFELGPCIGGALVFVPFLWIMGYNPSHNYELNCSGNRNHNVSNESMKQHKTIFANLAGDSPWAVAPNRHYDR